jgi:hypothetical protein
MKIKELLEDVTEFPADKVQPTSNPPKYGASVIPMQPYQQQRRLNQQRLQMEQTLDPFTQAYITAALWSSTDDDGDPLDNQYSIDDISDETFMEMVKDCQSFQQQNAELLSQIDDSQAGHDFWLTRCGHGAGFWDRGLGQIGDHLTDAAHAFGNVDLYVGDDGKIYG